MYEALLKVVDRFIVGYLAYRAGQSSVINKAYAKVIGDVERVKKLRDHNSSLSTIELLTSLYK